jgi:N-acetylglucosaminyl-diphospho-decaprenol L-rhamnosyltransferase
MMASSIDIVIVNWNAGRQLSQCLESINAADRSHVALQRTVVVDNASTDGSLEGVDSLGLPLEVIRNERNRGFAVACNQGAKGSSAEYLLFLNPDTRLSTNALSGPVAFMEQPSNQRIGILGIQLTDHDGRVARTCARFPTAGRFLSKMLGLDRAFPLLFPPHFMVEWDHRQSREVDQVMGAFFLIRRSLFETLGGFDERFFVYFEEVDLSVRAHALGWLTFYLSTAQAYHRGGGVTEQVKPTRLFYSLRSRIQYAYKHFNRSTATLLTLGTLFVEPVSRVALAIIRRSPSQLVDTVKGYALLWRALPRSIATSRHRGHA